MAGDWTLDEVQAAVEDYFSMLRAELSGRPYNKTAHRKALRVKLEGRTDGSVEYKHQNISAVLIERGLPYISGYKPSGNYQQLLAEEIDRYVARNEDLLAAVQHDVEQPAELPSVSDYLAALVDAPQDESFRTGVLDEDARPPATAGTTHVNYLEHESRNRSLGYAGELFVVNYERARLSRMGDGALADRIEHVSQTTGDSAGFDIRSFDDSGGDLFIEVKTTRYGQLTPFFVTSNELRFSRSTGDSYGLYRVFEFRRDPKLFVLPGPVDHSCALRPSQYRAWPPHAL